MKKIPLLAAALSVLIIPPNGRTFQKDVPAVKDVYFGQTPPGNRSKLFAPGFVSTGLEELVLTFMPDGKECYWSVLFSGHETILTSRWESGRWTEPEVAPFSGAYFDGWPAIQADGKRLFFHSARPHPDNVPGISAAFNIWSMDRTQDGWSEPKIMPVPVNGTENSTCPSVTKDGTIYFSKRYPDETEKLCRSEWRGGMYQPPEALPEKVNSTKYNFHGSISPDESYIVRPFFGRADAEGRGWNYYVSFRSADGGWSDLINLGKEVNSVTCAGAPSFSPDGKYLFFQARAQYQAIPFLGRKYSLKEMIDKENRDHSNGSADIYWIDAGFIEGLRPKK